MTHVLVVDDDGPTREMLHDVLEGEGYAVLMAPDGPTALTQLQATNTPLVVLLDEWMPGLAGSEVVEAYGAGATTSRQEFILMTANPESTSRRSRLPVLDKPFSIEELLDAVAKAAARLEGQ